MHKILNMNIYFNKWNLITIKFKSITLTQILRSSHILSRHITSVTHTSGTSTPSANIHLFSTHTIIHLHDTSLQPRLENRYTICPFTLSAHSPPPPTHNRRLLTPVGRSHYLLYSHPALSRSSPNQTVYDLN